MIKISNALKYGGLRHGDIKKGILVKFPNGEHEPITNSDVEAESLSMTESICSQSTMRLGTNEKAVLQFITRGVGDITGCEIEVELHISADKFGGDSSISTGGEVFDRYYKIPYGRYKVDSCEKDELAWERRKIIAYRVTDQDMQWDRLQLAKMKEPTDNSGPMKIDIMQAMYAQTGYSSTKVEKIGNYSYGEDTSYVHVLEIDVDENNPILESGTYNVFLYYEYGYFSEYNTGNASFDMSSTIEIEYDKKFSNEDALLDDIAKKIYDQTQACSVDEIREKVKESLDRFKIRLCEISVEIPEYDMGRVYSTYEYKSGDVLYIGEEGEGSTECKVNFATSYMIYVVKGYPNTLPNSPGTESFPIKENVKTYRFKSNMFNRYFKSISRSGIDGSEYYTADDIPDFEPYYKAYMEMMGCCIKNGRNRKTEYIDVGKLTVAETFSITDVMRMSSGKEKSYTVTLKDSCGHEYTSIETGDNEYSLDQNVIIGKDCKKSHEYQEIMWGAIAWKDMSKELVNSLAEKLNSMKYTPFRMKCIGLPHLEAGDRIRIETRDGYIEPVIMRRTISGIQHLVDTMETI